MSTSNAVLAVVLAVVVLPLLLLLAALCERRSALRWLSTAPLGGNADESPLQPHTACRIYAHVEREQDARPWGRVLDAGTGCDWRTRRSARL